MAIINRHTIINKQIYEEILESNSEFYMFELKCLKQDVEIKLNTTDKICLELRKTIQELKR